MVRTPGAGAVAEPLFDHHVHSDRSDGLVSLVDRARSAASGAHGISDHYPWPDTMRDDDDVLRYVDEAKRLGLRVGVEFDLGVAAPLRMSTRAALDYVIGSIHQIDLDGEWISYDLAGAFVKGLAAGPYVERARFSDPTLGRRLLERTLEVLREGIVEAGIDIVGHPTFSPLAALGDPEAAYPFEWQERFIALCVEADVAIEVNELYGLPHAAFLARAARAGARFSVGSDSHRELLPLDRAAKLIDAARLPRERFLTGRRARAA